LSDGIRERFEGWRKLDRAVPPVFQLSSAEQSATSTNLTTVLHKDIITRVMQHNLYLVCISVVGRVWRNSLELF
jgi:hypothetical protein